MSTDPIETRLSAARTRLILDRPFLGALVLRLPLQAADPQWCPTTATDARRFYYNPAFIASLSPTHLQFVLAHEALHCALSHFARRGHRNRRRWDLASDLAVNALLVADGLQAPPGALVDMGFEGMTAEEIYPFIEPNDDDEPMDRHVYDEQDQADRGQGTGEENPDPPPPPQDDPEQGRGEQTQKSGQGGGGGQPREREGRGAGQPPPLSMPERDALAAQWQQRLAGAAQMALQAGRLGDNMKRLIDHLLQPQLPWRSLLAHHVSNVARDDYSFSRPSTRRGDPVIYPSLRSAQIDVAVVLDTSGSVSEAELGEFVAEIDALKAQVRARVTLHACDAQLAGDGPWVFEAWDEMRLPESLHGGGGTDFRPVFDWLDAQDRPPDLLVYFTDAEGAFPERPPRYPVLWLIKGRAPVPWGVRVQLN